MANDGVAVNVTGVPAQMVLLVASDVIATEATVMLPVTEAQPPVSVMV